MIVKITDKRAIVVHDNSYALAKWTKKKNPTTKEVTYDWAEYMWPSEMDRAVNILAQEMMAEMGVVVDMMKFKAHFAEALEQIKKAIHEGR